jgi:hypothetical protein
MNHEHSRARSTDDRLLVAARQLEVNVLAAMQSYFEAVTARLLHIKQGQQDLRESLSRLEDRVSSLETRRPL